jgi:hypothetical protein
MFQLNSHLQVYIIYMSETNEHYFVHIVSIKEHIQSGFGNKKCCVKFFIM